MADLGFDFPDDEYDQDAVFEESEKEGSTSVTTFSDANPQIEEQQEHNTIESEIVPFAEYSAPQDDALIRAMTEEQHLGEELEDELLADENVTPIERVYGFRENDALINRLLLAKELPVALEEITLSEAIEDVLPIMDKLAVDTDDTVRETFAGELDQVLLYFYKNAPTMFSSKPQEKSFAPLIIRLLLDQSTGVASLGQQAVVSVVTELRALSDQNSAYQQVIDCEVFKGIIDGLMSIIDGKRKSPRLQDEEDQNDINRDEALRYHRVSIDDDPATRSRRPSTTPGFESSLNVHHASAFEDEFDQGEISLAKITCISLIASIVGAFEVEKCIEECLPIIEKLASDPLFYVRKEAAAAVGSMALVVDTKTAEERLLPLFRQFAQDQVWHVRRSCILTLPQICSVLSEETKAELTVSSVEKFRNDDSRNVRNAMADIIGDLISKFLPPDWELTGKPGNLPEPLLQYFLSLGLNASNNNNQMLKLEIDRTYICAYNFPAVVLTAGADYWNSHLRDTYLNLTKDYQIKVRCTFAHSLHDIARIIGPERTERDLVQIFALYLMDIDDVKQGVLEHLADFLGTLAANSRNEYIPILQEVWDGVSNNWHLRNILAGQLIDISLLFDASHVVECILPLVVRACHDEFAAVRETGVSVFPVVLDVVKNAVEEDGESLSQAEGYGDDIAENKRNYALALLSHVMERLDEFARSESYRGRLVFAQICKALIEAGIGASDFASFFLPRLAPLAHDPVVNVRIAASRTIGAIYKNEPFRKELNEIAAPSRTANQTGESLHALEQMAYRFALDKDSDVRSFVTDYIDNDMLEKQRKKEQATADILKPVENTQLNEEEEYEEEEDDEDDEDDESKSISDNDKLTSDTKEKSTSPMDQVITPPEEKQSKTDPMDISTDEDEIMLEAEDVATSATPSPVSSSPPSSISPPSLPSHSTTAVVLQKQDDKED
ncbi:armadillo-type protein [Choanephora cucurbitarum]|nr:armadillo-type protein [Choanephora cucurbitarum]KAI8370862.1 armadillo-type protein [Choanephora cucurbitarum]